MEPAQPVPSQIGAMETSATDPATNIEQGLTLTQAQATTLIMEVVRLGGKAEVERHGLWREIASAAGLPYKSDTDMERLLTQAATIRGAAGPTWEEGEREKANKKAKEQTGFAKVQSNDGEKAAHEGEGTTTTTATAPAAETAEGSGGKTKASKGKGKEKGKGADSEDSNGKKRKKRSSKGQVVEESPELELNVYTVERIMGKRKRRGKVEYLIKWEGYPESANTWEKEEDVFCTELIQAFEAELQERAKRKRKNSTETKTKEDAEAPQAEKAVEEPKATEQEKEENADKMDTDDKAPDSPKAKKPRKSVMADSSQKKPEVDSEDAEVEAKVGFDFGDEIENILGIQRTKDGFLCAYVTWLGKDDCSYVPTQLIALKSPQKLIAFYESHISFTQTPGQ